jgi:hypothetical protein
MLAATHYTSIGPELAQEERGMKNPLIKFAASAVTCLLVFVIAGGTAGSSTPKLGTYTMSIAAADILPHVPDEVRSNFDGRWELTFAKGNTYQISKDGTVVVEGRLASATDQLTFTDEKGVLACIQPPGMEAGTYKWNYDQQELTFTAVEDKCPGRRAVLSVHPWRKVK